MGVGDRVRRRRLELQMTQDDLAHGWCSRTYISRIECGTADPPRETLQVIADRLQTDVEWLMGGDKATVVQEVLQQLAHGRRLMRRGRLRQAADAFASALEVADRINDASLCLRAAALCASVLCETSQIEKAEMMVNRALRYEWDGLRMSQHASIGKLYMAKGSILIHKNEYTAAVEAYRRAQSLAQTEEGKARALWGIGVALRRQNAVEKALYAFMQGLQCSGISTATRSACQHGAAACYGALGRFAEARQQILEALKGAPQGQRPGLLQNLAIIAVIEGNHIEARRMFRQVLNAVAKDRNPATMSSLLTEMSKAALRWRGPRAAGKLALMARRYAVLAGDIRLYAQALQCLASAESSPVLAMTLGTVVSDLAALCGARRSGIS